MPFVSQQQQRQGRKSSWTVLDSKIHHPEEGRQRRQMLEGDFCAAGYYYVSSSFVVEGGSCEPVGRGYFSLQGDTERYPCDPGAFSDTDTAELCTPCPAGTFSNEPATEQCQFCHPGTYSIEDASILCEPCDPFYYSGYGSDFAIFLTPTLNESPTKALYCLEPLQPPPPQTTTTPTVTTTQTPATTATTTTSQSMTSPPMIGIDTVTSASPSPFMIATPSTPSWWYPTEYPTEETSLSFPSMSPTTTNTIASPVTETTNGISNQAILLPLLLIVVAAIVGFCAAFYQKPLVQWCRQSCYCSWCWSCGGSSTNKTVSSSTAATSVLSWKTNKRRRYRSRNRRTPPPPRQYPNIASFSDEEEDHTTNNNHHYLDDEEFGPPLHSTTYHEDHFSVTTDHYENSTINRNVANAHHDDDVSIGMPSVAGAMSVWSVSVAGDIIQATTAINNHNHNHQKSYIETCILEPASLEQESSCPMEEEDGTFATHPHYDSEEDFSTTMSDLDSLF